MKSDLDLIWRYFDRDLVQEEVNKLEQRLKTDPAFHQLFCDQQEIYLSLSKTEIIAFRKKLQKISRELKKNKSSGRLILLSYPWLIAAAIGLFCLSIGYILLRFSAGDNKPSPILGTYGNETIDTLHADTVFPAQIESVKRIMKDTSENGIKKTVPVNGQLLAESYKVNPLLEELIDIHYRTVLRKEISPENEQSFTPLASIFFRCHIDALDSIFLSVLNNKGDVIFEQPLPSGEFLWKSELDKGLFYFQMSTSKELICTRKFFIE